MSFFQGHKEIYKYDGSIEGSWLTYICGHCNTKVSGAVVASGGRVDEIKWLQCTSCGMGSVDCFGTIFPGTAFGPVIEGLSDKVKESYDEARRCISVNAYTACELICRKILMHIAVEKGAKEGETFAAYLSYLKDTGYITPPMRGWVDLIRQHGNKSTHQLEEPNKERAESTLMFTAELLRLIYEMEHIANKYIK